MQLSTVKCNTMFGTLILDRVHNTVTVGDRSIALSPAEVATLSLLIGQRNTPLSREAVVDALAADGVAVHPRMVDVCVSRLRRKLAGLDMGAVIGTAWGRGYMVGIAPREDEAPLGPIDGRSIAAMLTA